MLLDLIFFCPAMITQATAEKHKKQATQKPADTGIKLASAMLSPFRITLYNGLLSQSKAIPGKLSIPYNTEKCSIGKNIKQN